MKTIIFKQLFLSGFIAVTSLCGGLALAQAPYVNATVQGALSPGIYGRIDIGTAAPPPLIYAKPILVYPSQVIVQQPLYLHVPPGHAKKWSKHCDKYNACGQPVYFVRVNGDGDDDDDDEYEGRGGKHKYKGEGKHHGKDHD